MQRFILSSLSALLLTTAIAPVAQAQMSSEPPPANAATIGMAVTPFNLVFLAYQGFFAGEGIPQYDRLVTSYQSGDVTAEDLVRVAIGMRRLTPDVLENRGYLHAVEQQLDSLYGDD